jgi:uncharacterized membrane protein
MDGLGVLRNECRLGACMDYSTLIIVSTVIVVIAIFIYVDLDTKRENKYKYRELERAEELLRWLNYLQVASPDLYEKVVGKKENLH